MTLWDRIPMCLQRLTFSSLNDGALRSQTYHFDRFFCFLFCFGQKIHFHSKLLEGTDSQMAFLRLLRSKDRQPKQRRKHTSSILFLQAFERAQRCLNTNFSTGAWMKVLKDTVQYSKMQYFRKSYRNQ